MTPTKADMRGELDALKREAVEWYKNRFDRSDIIGMPSDREVLFDFIDHLAQRGLLQGGHASEVTELKNALRDVLKAIISDRHAVQDTIWVDGFTPIGDFIMGYLDEDIDLDELQNTPYRCNKTREMFTVPEGWVCVPREPTQAMLSAVCNHIENHMGSGVSILSIGWYDAMLSAATTPQRKARHHE